MWDWLADAYRTRIVDNGREPLFLLLVGLIGSFLFIRFSVRMIRRGVSWWPGNVNPGGLHIHHVVFGQAMMLIGGIGSFAVRGGVLAHNLLAVLFGIGCGLVLDEFALVLHLEDVYWSEQGRKSVDAVILAVAVIGLLLIGEAPLGGFVGGINGEQIGVAAVLLGFVVICLIKGKVWTGLIGVMMPPVAIIGALRLARPASPWSRWRYHSRPRRLARSERREDRVHRRLVAFKTRLMDAVAGAPHLKSKSESVPVPRPTVVDIPPSRIEVWLRPLQQPGAAVAVWYLRTAAVVNVLTGLIAPFRERVHRATNGEFFTAFLLSPGFTGAVLAFLLAVTLRRRKRASWIVAVTLVWGYLALCLLALDLLPEARAHPFNWISLGLTVLLALALAVSRRAFNVRGERGNVALGLVSLLIGSVVTVGLGTVLVHATDAPPPASWRACLHYAVLRVLTVSSLFDLPEIAVPAWTDLAINLLSVTLMLMVLLAFFRSPRGRARLQPADEQRLRELLAAHGEHDPVGYFALRRDKSVSWSPGGRAAVLYRVVNGVALASGDPIGDREEWPAAIDGWLADARQHAWIPGVTGTGGGAAAVYERAGLKSLDFGDEAVVDVAAFAGTYLGTSTTGAHGPDGGEALRPLREAHGLIRDAGYTAVVRRHRDIPRDEMADLAHLADAWRRHASERGFSVALGRLGDPADGECVMVECRDPQGRTSALLSFVPWGRRGLCLDLMRRDRESGSALIDYLITELLLLARADAEPVRGVERVSLNFAVFRSVFEEDGKAGAGPLLRLWRKVLRLLSRRWHLEARYRSYAAYLPEWRPRHLLYERSAELPRIAAATAMAEGFLTAPRLPRLGGAPYPAAPATALASEPDGSGPEDSPPDPAPDDPAPGPR
ncbi:MULTISPECIES: phosphatidylglycerol lysyltransferase domain-containing protein [Streptomyces]|uniref:phosphatidylglycerol lysyltransferase domain-containing protein n=1 Tax=Streptomyces TaxID=1883 RepID=UPI0018DF1B1E|nr:MULTISPECIES: phosphatidylglycerol lysyltransferase domain-containing protein [Streptomyces]MCZ4098623.1 phosphatidylglycerol lysyltransferase domain-containing protein [Streptomyces sp. H39-C1]